MVVNNINEVGKTYERPWGNYRTIEMANGYQVKVITVYPQGRLSLQKHFKRAEHWVVVSGTLTVTVDKDIYTLNADDKIYIPIQAVHRAENLTATPAVFVEVQIGSYLGEDDIVRIEDIYNR